MPRQSLLLIVFVALLPSLLACNVTHSTAASNAPAPVAAAAAPFASEAASEVALRTLEARVKRDPEDFIAFNKLAGYYQQRLRETGDLSYVDLASRAARASLAVLPAEQNPGGLHALAAAEFASHEFAAARDHAQQLVKLTSGKGYAYELLGDAFLELGEYEQAAVAYREMQRQSGSTANGETRFARLALLHGDAEGAAKRFTSALEMTRAAGAPSRETVAWCQWQLGETAFTAGDYEVAEKQYREALATFPDYYRALAGLGRVRAARGDLTGAIENYERAVRHLPDPLFVAALGDLYQAAGREQEAAAKYALVEQVAKLDAARGTLYNRQLALYYADHDLQVDAAYEQAKKEYALRRDIYGADALAWTALKAGRVKEAQAAMKEALRLGTRDARLFYHAGMIARAAGNTAEAREYLQRALNLSPRFDVRQAAVAAQTLAALQ